MSLRLHALLAALALMLASVAPALAGDGAEAADPGAPLAKSYPVWISLDAGGRVTAVDVEAGTSAPVATIVAGLVRDTPFAPATRDGVAVASEVPATVGVLFTPAGGGYAATLRWLKVQPMQAERMMPARYPARELRGAGARHLDRTRQPQGGGPGEAEQQDQENEIKGDSPQNHEPATCS